MHRNRVGALLILSSLTVFSMISCKGKGNTKIYSFDYKTNKLVDTNTTITLKFYDIPNLPYVSVKDYLDKILPLSIGNNPYSFSFNNNVFTLTNKIWLNKTNHGSAFKPSARFDVNSKSITYDDYPCFVNVNSDAYHPLDLVAGKNIYVENEYKNKCYLFPETPEYQYIAGTSTTINLSDYNLDARVENNNLYMPLYTVKSLFTSNYVDSYFYNGKALYLNVPNDDDYRSYCSTVKSGLFTPSSEYLNYSYNQLALDLDLHFGMGGFTRKMRKTSLGNVTYNTGLGGLSYDYLTKYKSKYLSSANGFEVAAIDLFSDKLDDGGHTGILSRGYFSNPSSLDRGEEFKYSYDSYEKIVSKTNDKYKDSIYVKHFSDTTGKYVLKFNEFNEDGLMLISFFCNQILENKSLEEMKTKAVIDLSTNGGGFVFLQHYLSQFLSGGNCKNAIKHSINGSKGYVTYPIDMDLDGDSDPDDYLPSGFTVDIICSNHTFSAANATACYAKEYQIASGSTFNILGEKTGGGVCAVDSTIMTPLGMPIQLSSPFRLTNASYNENAIDDGVEPSTTANKWNSHDISVTTEALNKGAKQFTKYYIGA